MHILYLVLFLIVKKLHVGKRDKSDANAIKVTNAIYSNLLITENSNSMVCAKGRKDYAITKNTQVGNWVLATLGCCSYCPHK